VIHVDYKKIKTLVVDLDGVLTNGRYSVFEDGKIFKSFHTRDFDAMRRLEENNINVIVLTQSSASCLSAKMRGMKEESRKNIQTMFNIEDKFLTLDGYLRANNLEWSDIAYMGDAENDIKCLSHAGISACPVDAIKEVKHLSGMNYISKKAGGQGCVYTFIKHIKFYRGGSL